MSANEFLIEKEDDIKRVYDKVTFFCECHPDVILKTSDVIKNKRFFTPEELTQIYNSIQDCRTSLVIAAKKNRRLLRTEINSSIEYVKNHKKIIEKHCLNYIVFINELTIINVLLKHF